MALSTENLDNAFAIYRRTIRCPRHYLLRPGGQPFVMERIPALKNIKEADAKIFGLNLWRKKKDARGNYIQNFKDYYQPEISAGFAKEQIYLPFDPICMKCKRCVTK